MQFQPSQTRLRATDGGWLCACQSEPPETLDAREVSVRIVNGVQYSRKSQCLLDEGAGYAYWQYSKKEFIDAAGMRTSGRWLL